MMENQSHIGGLPDFLGLKIVGAGDSWLETSLDVAANHLRGDEGGLHAATIVALADTACGYGCRNCLPNGARGFTTIELKSNFVGTVSEGVITCKSEAQHLGRTTQVWRAIVSAGRTQKKLAFFQCTQLILWP